MYKNYRHLVLFERQDYVEKVLYVVNTYRDYVVRFDNEKEEWVGCLISFLEMQNNKNFKKIESFENSHISTKEAFNPRSKKSLFKVFPFWFEDKFSFIKFYVTNEKECEGTLFVANSKNNRTIWFDNLNQEWQGSFYTYEDIDKDSFWKKVKKFDNGYINTDDVLNPSAKNNIIQRYSMWFEEMDEEENEI